MVPTKIPHNKYIWHKHELYSQQKISSDASVMLIERLKSVLVQREQVWESCPRSPNDGVWQLHRVIWKCHHQRQTFHHEIYGSGTFDANVKSHFKRVLFYVISGTTDKQTGWHFRNARREIADIFFCSAFEMDITSRCKSRPLHMLSSDVPFLRCH